MRRVCYGPDRVVLDAGKSESLINLKEYARVDLFA